MEEIFHCETWADATAMIEAGFVVPTGSKCPDFVCTTFPDGSLGIFEAKGTTGTSGNITGALTDGKRQTAGIGATDPIKCRVAVGCALGGGETRVVLLDPPGPSTPLGDRDAEPTNLTADIVRRAAKQMRASIRLSPTQPPEILPAGAGFIPVHERGGARPSPTGRTETTIFRGPGDGTGTARQIALTREDYREDKRHGWLEITK